MRTSSYFERALFYDRNAVAAEHYERTEFLFDTVRELTGGGRRRCEDDLFEKCVALLRSVGSDHTSHYSGLVCLGRLWWAVESVLVKVD
jgi:hypothetical protein